MASLKKPRLGKSVMDRLYGIVLKNNADIEKTLAEVAKVPGVMFVSQNHLATMKTDASPALQPSKHTVCVACGKESFNGACDCYVKITSVEYTGSVTVGDNSSKTTAG